ncbi:MAG: endonuclease domain-containing protein [Dongiaceae bacterium]
MVTRKIRGANVPRNSRNRELRHNSTQAERILWSALRNRRLAGVKIRRQFPIGPFVADFACVAQRLIIELDGAGHDLNHQADARRSETLSGLSYRVIRFSNDDVERNLEGVVQTILLELEKSCPLTLRPLPHFR